MNEYIAVLGGLSFSLITYICVYFHAATNKKGFEIIDWFLIAIATFNGIGFAFVIWATHQGENTLFWSHWLLQYDSELIITFFMTNLIIVFSSISGWYLTNTVLFRKNTSYIELESKDNSVLLGCDKLVSVAWIMLIISVFGYWLYTNAYGGFVNYINYSRAIRSGIISVTNPLSFLEKFGGFSFFATYIFFGLIIDKSHNIKTKKWNIILGFLISFLFSIYVLYSWVGRIAFVVHLLTFILGYALYNYKSINKLARKLFFIFIMGITVIVVFDRILERSKEGITVLGLFAKELSFPFAAYLVELNYQHHSWFKDVLVAPLFILPEKVWSLLNIETASNVITFLMLGNHKGEAGLTGSIPVDMLTFAWMQGSILGVIFVGFLWGLFLALLKKVYFLIQVDSVRNMVYANIILNVIFLSVIYGDPEHIITRNFYMIVGLSLLFLFKKTRIKTKKRSI